MQRKTAPKIGSTPVKAEKTDMKKVEATKVTKPIKYEFGGPIGSFFVVIGTPFVIFALFFLCNKDICLSNPFEFDLNHFKTLLPTSWNDLFSYKATAMYLGWLAFHVVLGYILPGESVDGSALIDGSTLKYTMSGHLQFWITLLVVCFGLPIISLSSR
jgi:delta14-sterol reductase